MKLKRIISSSLIVLSSCMASTAMVQGQSLGLDEILSSYAWGSAPGTLSGTYQLNLWNDSTGAFLTADNGDLPDLFISFSTNMGPRGSGGFAFTSSNTIRAAESFSGTPSANNPGSRVINTMTILFGSHLNITNLNADFSSLNSAGLAWETSRLAVLDAGGGYFSTPPALDPYLSHVPVLGTSPLHPGFFVSDSLSTVTGVGTTATSTGTASGPYENLTSSSGNNILDYTDLSLAGGTRIGGFEWISVLEDTRGTSNISPPTFTSTLIHLAVAGTIIPEPSVIFLAGASLMVASTRRRRQS